MGDRPSPFTPPPVVPPPSKTNMPMLYYGLVVVGTAFIVLAVYNFIIKRWCRDDHHRRSLPGTTRTVDHMSSRSFDNPNINLMSSFKYKKGGVDQELGYDNECSVCLSVFEEGEEVRQLPRCKHSFHAPCIDMWLYSHFDCPLCRALVEPPVLHCRTRTDPPLEHSREGLLPTSMMFSSSNL